MNIAWCCLNASESKHVFSTDNFHPPLALEPLRDASILWINWRLVRADPVFAATGKDYSDYPQHILQCCAFKVCSTSESALESDCVADRYGGSGIGHNGGSGRAIVHNGYSIKGVGRTPLVSAFTDPNHASGGAYLEECVREVVLSEIVDMEFPFGAVPILAVILTGETKYWPDEDKFERQCLLVRPVFIRPAHFERAPAFVSENFREGALDRKRVESTFRAVASIVGRSCLTESFNAFWGKWVEQLAYAYVHRLSHGGAVSSNICLDGRLVDFGGMSSLSSLARFDLSVDGPPAGEELVSVLSSLESQMRSWSVYVGLPLNSLASRAQFIISSYQRTIYRETLRLLGLTQDDLDRVSASPERSSIEREIRGVLRHFKREHTGILIGDPLVRLPWQLGAIWSDDPPRVFLALRDALSKALFPSAEKVALWESRSIRLCLSRPRHSRERLKTELYRQLEMNQADRSVSKSSIDRLIDRTIVSGRRDSKYSLFGKVLVGFARSVSVGLALFKRYSNGQLSCVVEWSFSHSDKVGFEYLVEEVADEHIVLSDSSGTRIAFDQVSVYCILEDSFEAVCLR